MAWYSLWKWFSPWSKRDYPNMIYWYSEYVLKTPQQRERERTERKKCANTVLAQICIMNTICNEINSEY